MCQRRQHARGRSIAGRLRAETKVPRVNRRTSSDSRNLTAIFAGQGSRDAAKGPGTVKSTGQRCSMRDLMYLRYRSRVRHAA